MSLLLPAAVGEHRAKEILFFNEELGAARLLELGIANRVFLPEDLEESTGELARKLTQVPRQSVAATKVIMNQAVTSQLDMVMAAETSASPLCAGIIRETEESAKR